VKFSNLIHNWNIHIRDELPCKFSALQRVAALPFCLTLRNLFSFPSTLNKLCDLLRRMLRCQTFLLPTLSNHPQHNLIDELLPPLLFGITEYQISVRVCSVSAFLMASSRNILSISEWLIFMYLNCSFFNGWSQRPLGLRHELSSLPRTLGSWIRIPLKEWVSVCVYSVFVFFCL
jgi:hypothetical protein